MDLSTDCASYSCPASPTSQNKRANKPLVERKRRGRINKSIDELKHIVLQAMNKDDKDYCKMEKADILEMVVRHLKAIRRSQLTDAMRDTSGPGVWNNYRAGFNECATEVMQYMRDVHCVDTGVQVRMLNHLAECVQRINSFPPVDVRVTSGVTPQQVVTSRLPTTPAATAPFPVSSMTSHPTPTPRLTSATSRMTSPPATSLKSGLGLPGMPSPGLPSATLEANLPGSRVTVKHESSPPTSTPSRGAGLPRDPPRPGSSSPVDQIVPGSHSPDLVDHVSENTSMVAEPSEQLIKRGSPRALWREYSGGQKMRARSASPHLKASRSPVKGQYPVKGQHHPLAVGDHRKTVHSIRDMYANRVWRPW